VQAAFTGVIGVRLTDSQISEYLAQHDFVYDAPPNEWLHGIPLANGRIGAMIWGDGGPMKITLDKYDCWELREQRADPEIYNYENLKRLIAEGDEDETRRQMVDMWRVPELPHPTRLPMPRMELDFGHCEGFDARLHLLGARADGTLTTEKGSVAWRAFVHADLNVMIVDLAYDGPARLVRASCSLDHLNDEAKQTLRDWGYEDPETGEEDGCEWLRLRFPMGGEYVVGWRRVSTGPDRDRIVVAMMSHHDSEDPRASVVRTLVEAGAQAEALYETHADWWREYWRRSWLSIPDSRLEALYCAEIYKLGCSSRPGSLPITLQGLWTADGVMPPWSGDYHMDMNVQESYWPIYTANRLELGECLYDTFTDCISWWEERCREFFGFDGLWSGCAIAPNGARVYGYHGAEYWPGNAAWLAHHYWLHWLYSQDQCFLRTQALPMMHGAMLTYQNLLEEGEDGKLHLPLGYSPEWGEGAGERYAPDPSGDLALIRFLGEALLEAAAVLEIEGDEVDGWRETMQKLAPYPQGGEGLWVTSRDSLWESHRHHSHLMAIHPLGVLNTEQGDEQRSLIARSLNHWVWRGTGAWTGWAFPWASLIASRAGQQNLAYDMLRRYADAFIMPNTMHVNGDPRQFGHARAAYTPMTLEAGLTYAAAIMEMLLQSWGGVIRLFPTVPDRWHETSFEDLRAEGAFIVSARLSDDEVVYARIVSEVGGICRMRNPWPGQTAIVRGAAGDLRLEGETVEWETEAGAEYVVVCDGAELTDDQMQPVVRVRSGAHAHWFGVKKLARF